MIVTIVEERENKGPEEEEEIEQLHFVNYRNYVK